MRSESAKAAGLRKRILGLVREHARLTLGERRFVPGESLVHYAGRVYDEEEVAALADSSLDFWLTHGPLAGRFERGLSKFLGLSHALLVNSGSSANLLAVSALRSPLLDDPLRPGDEVITPALTFPTTLAPILQNGLVPVFVDVDPATYCLDASRLEAALSPKTRAIFLPHTLGNPCDMRTVLPLVKEKGLYLIEDACDALGASFDGRRVGTLGDVGTVSFYPAHHMTLGEGGAVFTGNGRLKRALASLRDWGRDCWCDSGKSDTCGRRFGWKLGLLPEGYDHKYIYSHVGYNLKALDLQAAIGLEQLKKLPGFIRSRNANFARLKKGLSPFSDVLRLPETYPGAEPSWFALPLTVREDAPFTRRDIVGHLESRRIETRMLFAGNILKQPAYCAVPHRVAGGLGNTDAVMERSFFVGVYPGLVPQALDYMVDCIADFIRKAKAKPPR